MTRVDGRKVVIIAVGGMTLALGIGTVYLPYFADRDKIRGLFEDENKTAEELQQMQLKLKQEHEERMRRKKEEEEKKKMKNSGGGSMWSNLRWGISTKQQNQQQQQQSEKNDS